jgi:hypothetical protein
LCFVLESSVVDDKDLDLNFNHFKLQSSFFRSNDKSKKTFPDYKGFLNYKFNNLDIRPSFIFNDSFKVNKNYNYNFIYHNLFGFFRDYYSWVKDQRQYRFAYPKRNEILNNDFFYFFVNFFYAKFFFFKDVFLKKDISLASFFFIMFYIFFYFFFAGFLVLFFFLKALVYIFFRFKFFFFKNFSFLSFFFFCFFILFCFILFCFLIFL